MPSIALHHTPTRATITGGSPPSATATKAAVDVLPSLAQDLASELSSFCATPLVEMDTVARYHNHDVGPNQCCSAVVKRISAPIETVWGLVRRFDQPQVYKQFLRSCRVVAGDGSRVGCLREVHVVSGLPATSSMERLEILDEEYLVIGFHVVGGEHRLKNYRSVTSLHRGTEEKTVVVESYVVDIPEGNTKEETCLFVDTIVGCNLQSLSQIVERMTRSSSSSSSSSSTICSSCKVS